MSESKRPRKNRPDDPEVQEYMREREMERLMAAPDLDMGEYKDGVYRPPSGKKKHKWRRSGAQEAD